MPDRHDLIRHTSIALLLTLAACSAPGKLPTGPTPIPTLIPVSESIGGQADVAEASFTTLSYPAQLPSAERGYEIYAEHCEECHGPHGTGIVPGARDFSDTDFMRGETPADFYAIVSEGRNEMPGYADTLSSDERWDAVFLIWRFSTTDEAIREGSQIYSQQCSPCHGVDGTGEVLGSADFTDLREMDALAPRDLYLTVTQGRGSMPAWQSLLDQDQRWAVIDFLRTFTYDPTLPDGLVLAGTGDSDGVAPPAATCVATANPFDWQDPDAIQAGQELYADQCAACHGADGSGGLPNTPDFTNPSVGLELETETASIFCVLAEGTGAMPGFQRTLSDEQRWQVLTYLQSLAP